jgi:putative inorganic carbon (HCO3(-)) transporter
MLSWFLVAALLGAPIAFWAALANRRLLIRSLPFLVGLSGIALRVNGVSVRIDQLAGLLLLWTLLGALAIGRRRLYLDNVTWAIGLLAAVNLLSSLVYSPDRRYSLMQVLNLLSVWCLYPVVTNFLPTLRDVNRYTAIFLRAGALLAAIGVVAFALASVGWSVGGANLSIEETAAIGAVGTMREPNLYGSFCQIFFVCAIAILVLTPRAERGALVRSATVTAAVCAIGLILSFTRGAWIGAVVGIGAVAMFARAQYGFRIKLSRVVPPLLLLVATGMVIYRREGIFAEFLRYKFLNLFDLKTGTGAGRVADFLLAWQDIVTHPWLGSGTYSFAVIRAEGVGMQEIGDQGNWIGNYLLLALHDTGAVGLAIFVYILWATFRRGVSSLRVLRRHSAPSATMQIGLLSAFGGILVSFLSTTGFSLGYSWLTIALIGSFSRAAAQLEADHSVGEEVVA